MITGVLRFATTLNSSDNDKIVPGFAAYIDTINIEQTIN